VLVWFTYSFGFDNIKLINEEVKMSKAQEKFLLGDLAVARYQFIAFLF
jgi:hypothetical protein